jgi:DNA-binding CsgD family transcriptional regulator
VSCCPTCGQNITNVDFRIDLDNNFAVRGDRIVKLTAQRAELAYFLLNQWPGIARMEAIYIALWGTGDEPENAPGTIRAQITELRRQLAGLGVEIINHWSRGYALKLHKMPLAITAQAPSVLNGREEEIADYLRSGLSRKQIARRLNVSKNTVIGFISRRSQLAAIGRKAPSVANATTEAELCS